MIAKLEGLKKVIWIGMHIDMPEYMSMAQDGYNMISKGEAQLIFPTYHSFLGSLGLLISNENLSEVQ
jgi:hypothetical protein